VAKLLMI